MVAHRSVKKHVSPRGWTSKQWRMSPRVAVVENTARQIRSTSPVAVAEVGAEKLGSAQTESHQTLLNPR